MNNENKSLATRTVDQNQCLQKLLNDAIPELRKVAPKYVKITRMISLAIEAKMRNPLLTQCSPVSVLSFCKRCAEAGTDRIGAGGMWAVPFWSKKQNAYEMVAIPDWRLLIEKCKKAKAILHATAEAVYANDEFLYERGLEPKLVHKPALSDRGELKAVYCIYVLPDNTKDFVVMDWMADIMPIRDRTNAWKAYKEKGFENPWVTDPAEQSKKTVVKRALKIFEGASIELTALIAADNVVNGFTETDLTVRLPVAMPKELPESTEVKPETQTPVESKKDAPPPPATEQPPEPPSAEENKYPGNPNQPADIPGDEEPRISDPQSKRFYAIWKGTKRGDEEMRAYIFSKIGSTHTKDIPRRMYEEMCEYAGKKPE